MTNSPFARPIPDTTGYTMLPPHKHIRLQENAEDADQAVRGFVDAMGSPTGRGSKGNVWTITMSNAWRTHLQSLMDIGVNVTHLSWPRRSTKLAVKVQQARKDDDDDFSETAQEWVEETEAHEALHHLPFVPRLYLALTAGHYRVTVMQHVTGKVLYTLLPDDLTPKIYRRVEQAARDMWRAGWAHGDFHPFNVLVTSRGHVYVVDFGGAVKLPEIIRAQIRRSAKEDTISLWDQSIQPYVDKYKHSDGYTWYNPNGKALRVLRAMAKRELKQRHG